MKFLVAICRILLVGLFSYTLYHKFDNLQEFETTLLKSTLINPELVPFLKYAVPFSEILVLLFLVSKKHLYGFYGALILLLAFTIYLIILNNFSLYDGCSCGGVFNKMTYSQHLLVNATFIAVCVSGILLYTPNNFHITRSKVDL